MAPYRCTGITTRVRLLIAASTWRASMLPVSGSTSTSRTFAPACRTALAVATNVIGVVMTSSSGPRPSAVSERNSALVQLETVTTCWTPRRSANARSNAAARGPVVRKTLRRTSPTAAMSASVIEWR